MKIINYSIKISKLLDELKVLYRYANIESCQRDFQADCLAKFAFFLFLFIKFFK